MLGLLGVGPLNSHHESTNYLLTQAVIVFEKHPSTFFMDLRPWLRQQIWTRTISASLCTFGLESSIFYNYFFVKYAIAI